MFAVADVFDSLIDQVIYGIECLVKLDHFDQLDYPPSFFKDLLFLKTIIISGVDMLVTP